MRNSFTFVGKASLVFRLIKELACHHGSLSLAEIETMTLKTWLWGRDIKALESQDFCGN